VIPINDLSRAEDVHGEKLHSQLLDVVQSGSYILGAKVTELELGLATYLGCKHVIAVASGTDALVLALRALGVSTGDSVATTANAGGYTTTALTQIGASPVFVDCLDSGQMSVQDLRRVLESGYSLKAVVLTHLFGLTGPLSEVRVLCDEFGVLLVEDCAQSTGATIDGVRTGSVGDVSTFSFYPTKNLGALGDGGAVATSSPEIATRARKLRQYGWSSRYQVGLSFGTNSRMDEIQATVLLHRLPELDEMNRLRRSIWETYSGALEGSRWRLIGRNEETFVAHLAVLVAPQGLRDESRDFLERNGVSTGIHYPILDYLQPAWESSYAGSCPVAEDLVERIFTIPLFPQLTSSEIEHISRQLVRMVSEVHE
jgi:dTDP-4-amino-4,6-dideoxygalactose transaminase